MHPSINQNYPMPCFFQNYIYIFYSQNIPLPSKRTRGRRRNMSLQDLKGTTLVQFLPHTLAQAKCQISGSLGIYEARITKFARRSDVLSHIQTVKVEELTVHRCKTHGKPKTAAPELGGPDHWTQPNEICTSGFPLAELQTFSQQGSIRLPTRWWGWLSSVGLKRKMC